MNKLAFAAIAPLLAVACNQTPDRLVDPARQGMQPPPDTCGAQRYAGLLGKSVAEAPAPGPDIRIASDVAPITEDYRPGRLNIFYDEATRKIVGIRCF